MPQADTVHKAPIFIMSFNRPAYLRAVLESLKSQIDIDLAQRNVTLFQDGAVNPHSGLRHAADEDVRLCIDVFNEIFPQGSVCDSPDNLGVALNFDRAERRGFEDMSAGAVIFLEDDLVLGPHYLSILDRLIERFLDDERVGYLAAYGDHTKSLVDQKKHKSQFISLTHNWGFAVYRRQWLRMRARVVEYLKLVKNTDYRNKDGKAICELYASWGFGCPAISQDAAKTIACCADNVIKLNTYTCHAKYVGERGLHMNPLLFEQRGYSRTELYGANIFDFESLDKRRYQQILGQQLGWARKEIDSATSASFRSKTVSEKASQDVELARTDVESVIVTAAYRALLGRNPDPDGFETYMRLFRDKPLSEALQTALERLLKSSEFSLLHQREPLQKENSKGASAPIKQGDACNVSQGHVIPTSDITDPVAEKKEKT